MVSSGHGIGAAVISSKYGRVPESTGPIMYYIRDGQTALNHGPRSLALGLELIAHTISLKKCKIMRRELGGVLIASSWRKCELITQIHAIGQNQTPCCIWLT